MNEVLNDGFVRLVDHMGSDAAIVDAARTTSGTLSEEEKKSVLGLNDVGLLRYLMRHRHTTPFEFGEIHFHIRIPMDAWRQMIRHRTANVNEYSTRYSEAIDSQQKTPDDQWRQQSVKNRQGSSTEMVTKKPEHFAYPPGWENAQNMTAGDYLSMREEDLHVHGRTVYEERLAFGVAKEQARKDLPLSTYTEARWKCDLHNLFHFLSLRMDSHAQLEIRLYANAIAQIVKELFPICYEAFEDYRLNAMQLSALDIKVLHLAVRRPGIWIQGKGSMLTEPIWKALAEEAIGKPWNKRELEEFIDKIARLGMLNE